MKCCFYGRRFKARRHLMLKFLMGAYLMRAPTIIYSAVHMFIILVVLNLQLFSATCVILLPPAPLIIFIRGIVRCCGGYAPVLPVVVVVTPSKCHQTPISCR